MQLFSYLSDGKVRFACLSGGNIGIDIHNAYETYLNKKVGTVDQIGLIPNSIIDLFSQGENGKQTVQLVIDWVQRTLTEFESDYYQIVWFLTSKR